ncbi:hypothetical protein E4K64_33735 [Bradyrhizobium frederickii]|uniref:Abortive infection protein-like C-terminal domain-containing protein n=1 Tax=Bradyrhizobium frederickii TaxID=2560054 RepID=A0A4Y9NSA0_9BRAD|nr:hypothetical protein [Bradyrhizobium frederickii]TFV69195.1 hypothetical protein E4K64_33735 [Bradyrhizobium frederickii]
MCGTSSDLYSKRKLRESGTQPDIYQYDHIPYGLKMQIEHIWDDAIGVPYYTSGSRSDDKIFDVYFTIAKILRREFSVMTLLPSIDQRSPSAAYQDVRGWFERESNVDRVLDAVELSFRLIDGHTRSFDYLRRQKSDEIATEAINELNTRFKEHGVGYQFVDRQIVRIDSAFIHAEAVIPALDVLRGVEFKNAQDEFLSAFEHYRHGKHEEALVDCAKSFESTMKIICHKRGWPFDPNRSTASELVKTCLDKGLIPAYWESHFTGLRTILSSGIPTARNRQGGHGAGTLPNNEPPAELVSYVLHMTASTILFLSEAEKKLP